MWPQIIPHRSLDSISKTDFLALLKSSRMRKSTENCRSFPQWLAQKAWKYSWLPEMQIARRTSVEIRSFISTSKSIEPSWNLIFILTGMKMNIQVWIRKITKLPFSEMAIPLWEIVFLVSIWTFRTMGCSGIVGTVRTLAADCIQGFVSNFFLLHVICQDTCP